MTHPQANLSESPLYTVIDNETFCLDFTLRYFIENTLYLLIEGGVAALGVFELLPGYWRALLPRFYCLRLDICRKKYRKY